jgi:hypothetical protein
VQAVPLHFKSWELLLLGRHLRTHSMHETAQGQQVRTEQGGGGIPWQTAHHRVNHSRRLKRAFILRPAVVVKHGAVFYQVVWLAEEAHATGLRYHTAASAVDT